jgi:retron-type reverse transcriptase
VQRSVPEPVVTRLDGSTLRITQRCSYGSPVSPLLANIALHVLDEAWVRAGWRLGKLVRFADDYVVLCASQERAEQARDLAETTLRPLGLRLHPDKTKIVDIRAGQKALTFWDSTTGW